jgi:hypothetical protein
LEYYLVFALNFNSLGYEERKAIKIKGNPMLKIINGGRDALEVEVLRTIWLGSKEDADRLISRLKRNPNIKLRLVRSSKVHFKTKTNKTRL